MKILIVEDTEEKFHKINEYLKQNNIASNSKISHASCAVEAREMLRKEHYNLLLLDVVIPNRKDSGAAPSKNIGLDLLDELVNGPLAGSTDYIVGLTGYADVYQEVNGDFLQLMWHVLEFSYETDDWQTDLSKVISHIYLSEKDGAEKYATDVLVVTALEKPEQEAVMRWNCDWELDRKEEENNNYYKGVFTTSSDKKRSIVSVSAPRMGMVAASTLTSEAINKYRPKLVIMTGICGGVEGEVELGDCLIANPCWDYQAGKWTNKGFQVDPHHVPINSRLRCRLAEIANDSKFIESIKSKDVNGLYPKFDVKIAPVASGSAVVAEDGKTENLIIPQHRKVSGIDMEIYGFYAAAHDAKFPEPLFFAVKSVCDYANSHKNDNHQQFCSYASAEVAHEFLSRYLDEIVQRM